MTPILAIDPGPEQSAYVAYDGHGHRVLEFEKVANNILLARLEERHWTMKLTFGSIVIEQVAAMGMAVGAEVFETVFWSGRFVEAWGGLWDRLKRHEVKIHLCGNMRAKDANIRQALIDRFGPGKELAIGRKVKPGPLYGLSGDCWQALALAVTWSETRGKEAA